MESYRVEHLPAQRQHKRPFAFIAGIIMMIACILIPFAVLSSSAHAGVLDDWLCGSDLGGSTQFTSSQDAFDDDGIMSRGGKYSVMDLYASSLRWTTYNGRIGDDKLSNFNLGDLSGVTTSGSELTNVTKASDGIHSGASCVAHFFGTGIGNIFLGISGLVVKFISVFSTYALNPNIICSDPANPAGNCINLIGIIGGTGGSNGGIIGTLYNGLYISLAWMVILIAAAWAFFKLIKGGVRDSLFGVIWAVLAFVVGVAALNNPMLLAEFPTKASVALGSCVTTALNGHSCLSGDAIPTGSSDSDTMCYIDPTANIDATELLSVNAREATCKMWKAFVLEPWTEGQFGMSYESLDTATTDLIKQSPNAKNLDYWKKIQTGMDGTSPNDVCRESGRDRYSNVALYQLDLMSNIHDCNGNSKNAAAYHSTARTAGDSNVYNDWYYLIDIMSQAKADTGTGADNISQAWTNWTGSSTTTRTNLGVVAIIASIMAATIIIPSAVFCIGYMFMGTILMVFAPMFMLAGIQPTVGRRIFLGWLELVISAVMKYFFMVLWIYIVVEIYGAILGSSTSSAMTLVFIIAMTVTLKAYGKELRDIFGHVDLGGKKLSNAMGNKFNNVMGKTKTLRDAAIGGATAGLVNGEGGLGSRLRNAKDMAGFQTMQAGKYMGGFTGNMMMSADKILDKRRRNMVDEAERQNAAGDEALARVENAADEKEGIANIEARQGLDGFDINGPDAHKVLDRYYRNQQMNIRSREEYGGINEVENARKMAGADWDKKVNSAQRDGAINRDAEGIYRVASTSAGASKEAAEAAYRNNMKEQAQMLSSAQRVTDAHGIAHYQFDNIEDENRFNALSNVINDRDAMKAHQDWMKDTNDYSTMAAQEAFDRAKKQGKIGEGVKSLDELDDRRDQRRRELNDLDNKYHHTAAAISAQQQASKLSQDESQLRMQVDNLHRVNDEVTGRTEGAMWSGHAARKLQRRGAAIDAAINGGGDVGATMGDVHYLNTRKQIFHDIGNGVGRVAAPIASRTGVHEPHPFQSLADRVNAAASLFTPPQDPNASADTHYDGNGNYIG